MSEGDAERHTIHEGDLFLEALFQMLRDHPDLTATELVEMPSRKASD